MKRHFSFDASKDLADDVDALCRAMNWSRSDAIRACIRHALDDTMPRDEGTRELTRALLRVKESELNPA